jgi:hypothetical protein
MPSIQQENWIVLNSSHYWLLKFLQGDSNYESESFLFPAVRWWLWALTLLTAGTCMIRKESGRYLTWPLRYPDHIGIFQSNVQQSCPSAFRTEKILTVYHLFLTSYGTYQGKICQERELSIKGLA